MFGAITLLDTDGSTLLTDKDAILKGGQSSSIECENRLSSINDDDIDRLPQFDEFSIVFETPKAIQKLPSGYPWQRK